MAFERLKKCHALSWCFLLRCCVAAVSVVFVCRLGANFSSGGAAEAHGSGCLCALAVGSVAVAVAVAGVCAEQL